MTIVQCNFGMFTAFNMGVRTTLFFFGGGGREGKGVFNYSFIHVLTLYIHFCCSILLLQMAEYRISIYGRKQSEWDQMASWIVNNELYSENVVWLIQVLTRICEKSNNEFILFIGEMEILDILSTSQPSHNNYFMSEVFVFILFEWLLY